MRIKKLGTIEDNGRRRVPLACESEVISILMIFILLLLAYLAHGSRYATCILWYARLLVEIWTAWSLDATAHPNVKQLLSIVFGFKRHYLDHCGWVTLENPKGKNERGGVR